VIDLRNSATTAAAVIAALGLAPHPEGGHYRETWRERPADGSRGAGTAILFLLSASERSRWHRVDAAELWLWQAGAALELELATAVYRLGPDLDQGETLQRLVPAGRWQSAASLGAWTLVTCVVVPAFEFAGFELAPPGWSPPDHAAS
jgi:predicted cupin superfamily sugar epimerase